MPVIAARDVNTDVKDVITENGMGYWSESTDEKELKRLANKLCAEKDSLPVMGSKARRYLEENYNVKTSYKTIVKHFHPSNINTVATNNFSTTVRTDAE